MADDQHTVEVKLVADASKLRETMKTAVDSTKSMGNMSQRMRKAGIRGHKDLAKITKKLKKDDSGSFGASLRAEKKLAEAMRKRISTMRDLRRAGEGNRREIEKEFRALQKLEKAHSSIRGQRHKAGMFTGRERMSKSVSGSGLAGAANAVGGGLLGIGSMIAGAIVGVITSQLTSAYSMYVSHGKAQAGLIGSGTAADYRKAKFGGAKFGYSAVDTAGQALGAARATGQLGSVTTSQALSRATSLDVGESTNFMGMLTRAGHGFGGKGGTTGKREMVNILAAGTASGLDRARMPEFFQSVTQLAQIAGSTTGGDINTSELARVMSAFGASGQSGLQGARGASVAAKLDAAIKGPGGGEQGDALVLRSLGFGKPGGEANYYEARRRKERGFVGEGGTQNLIDLWRQVGDEYGGMGGQKAKLAFAEVTKLSLDLVESIKVVMDKGLSAAGTKAELSGLTTAGAGSIEEQALAAMKEGFGHVAHRIAELDNRSLKMGETIAADVEAMQDAINSIVMHYFPDMVEALHRIRGGVDAIHGFLVELWGNDLPAAEANQRLAEGNKELTKIVREYQAGTITKEEATTRGSRVVGSLEGARMRTQNHVGTSTLLWEAVKHGVTKIMQNPLSIPGHLGLAPEGPTAQEEREERIEALRSGSNKARNLIQSIDAGGVWGTGNARDAINDFVTSNASARATATPHTGEDFDNLFRPGGALGAEFREFVEQNQSSYAETQILLQQMAATVSQAEQSRAADRNADGHRATPPTIVLPPFEM